MRKKLRKTGVLVISLALLLALAGCNVDAGLIDNTDGPVEIITHGEDDYPENVANEPEEFPEDKGELPEVETEALKNETEPAGDAGTVAGGEDRRYEDGLPEGDSAAIDEDGTYNSAEDVSLYLYTFDHLPENYITKKEARDLGWSGGSVEKYAPGCAIGGDTFGNREGVLPDGKYHECDIDTIGENSRGAKRLVYSDDGRIYYTEVHYETFTLLYGEE